MDRFPEEELGEILTQNGWTISVAETTAGGLISAKIVSVPGSSAYFERGIVAYSKASKIELLGVAEEALAEFGAVSEETAKALAEGVRRVSGSTFGLAETGIAGPLVGRSPKPVGSVCIAAAGPSFTRSDSFALDGDRSEVRARIAEKSLELLLEWISDRAFSS